MSNRRKIKQRGQIIESIKQAASAGPVYECPDCNVDTGLVEVSPGVLVIQVYHDDTCPTFLRMETS